jgi:prepilin-type processing-associated H-X9-DG protein
MPPGIGTFPSPNLGRCPTSGSGFGGAMYFMLPFVEQDNLYKSTQCSGKAGYDVEQGVYPASKGGVMDRGIKTYICPSDPTANNGFGGWAGIGSYVYNGMIFQADWVGYSQFPATLQDGTSNTILFTETYAGNGYNGDQSLWWWDYNSFQTPAASNGDCGPLGYSGPTFTPMIQPPVNFCKTNTTSWSWGGTVSVCMCKAVSPHSGGINAALGDGSVRFVSGGISGATWYAACTPASGDTLGSDW